MERLGLFLLSMFSVGLGVIVMLLIKDSLDKGVRTSGMIHPDVPWPDPPAPLTSDGDIEPPGSYLS